MICLRHILSDIATTHSQKCCERLVDEGAVEILLYQITAVTRSIPDQEVMKHCLSTLRNLSKYADLADALIAHRGSIETILREFLRSVFLFFTGSFFWDSQAVYLIR